MENPAQWQSLAALAIVAITLIAFIVRAVRKVVTPSGKNGSCGEGCGCSAAGKPDFSSKIKPPVAPKP
ncbi:MAG: hypothetical protein R3F19_04515 [Verrucomicrobiales bacterium]|nr:hypothetical protein [Verrucomicrobiae bacterium]